MANVNSVDALKPASASGWSRQAIIAKGTVLVSTNPTAADTFTMVKLPKGALVLGGRIMGDGLASGTAGCQCLVLNIGVDQPITLYDGTAVTAASTSVAMGSFAMIKDAVAGIKPEVGYNMPLGGLLMTSGPFLLTAECNAVITVSTAIGNGSLSTGELTLEVEYFMAQHA